MSDDVKDMNDLIESTNQLKDIHHEIDETIQNEIRNTTDLGYANIDLESILGDVKKKEKEITDITLDEYELKQAINDILEDKKKKLDDIIRNDHLHIQNLFTFQEEYKNICGYADDLVQKLQQALAVQQQLNNTASQNNNGGGNTNGNNGGGGNNNGNNNGGGNNNGNNNGKKKKTPKERNWYDKNELAYSAFQGSVNIITKYASDIINKWIEIDKKVFQTGRQMGMTAFQIKGWQSNILKNYDEMANKLGMTFEEIFKFQDNYQQAIGKSVILSNKQTESFAAISKFAGDNSVNEMVKSMDILGSTSQRAIDYLTLGMARASSQGLNIKETSEKFAANIKMASRYNFKNGIDGINKMTLLSQKLKFNMDSISSALDNYSSLETAISTSAQLQVLGGSYAANFANPILAAGEAMLDPEKFTERIINTFAQNAIFDKESGEVKMSPIEKAKLKEASKALQINYEEAWNMAAQSAKIRDIESQIDTSKFTDSQKAFLANTSQYDAKTKTWSIIKMTENGAEKINIADLQSGKDLEGIQESYDFEKYIQGDVHSIREMLSKYLGQRVDETKTAEEIKTGQTERLKIFGANFINPLATMFKEWVKNFNMIEFALLGVTYKILRHITTNSLGNTARNIRKGKKNGGNGAQGANGSRGSSSPRGRGAKGSVFGKGIKRGLTRTGLKLFGRGGLKGLGKSIPVIGSAVAIGMMGYDLYGANNEHHARVNEINDDATLSPEEKAKEINKSKKERNTKIGGAIGGAASSILLGAVAGSALGPVGAILGGVGGYFLGDKIGSFLGSKITPSTNPAIARSKISTNSVAPTIASSSIVNNSQSNTNYLASENYSLASIQSDVSSIKDTIIKQTSGPVSATPILPHNQYEEKTYIRDNSSRDTVVTNINRPSVERIDLNISGTLKIQSGNKSQNLNLEELFNTPEFQRLLINKINEGLSRNTNAVQTRSLDSTQSIMGGYYTPNQMNSK